MTIPVANLLHEDTVFALASYIAERLPRGVSIVVADVRYALERALAVAERVRPELTRGGGGR